MSKKQNTINPRFVEYFRETFFSEKPDEFARFLESTTKPLPKTIRVNTNRISIEDFQKRADRNGWTLTPTRNPTVFRIDREDTRIPLGHTLEHLLGYFYIQELAASMSVHYLAAPLTRGDESVMVDEGGLEFASEHTINPSVSPQRDISPYQGSDAHFLILDMAASPGGKTTQLAEHFPHAFIVGNEPTRERTAQLVQNTERMGSDRIALSNYDGIFWGQFPETFDRILLDAPCSGEGIGFKTNESLRYWNIKNIHKIARLQEKLLDAAFRALKTGGEMLYSTCTLNTIENEWVVDTIRARYPESFEVIFSKRFWPHLEETGGFFVCRIRKKSPLVILGRSEAKIRRSHDSGSMLNPWDSRLRGNDSAVRTNDEITPVSREDLRIIERFADSIGLNLSDHLLYRFRHDILAVRNHPGVKSMLSSAFLIRLGQKIGRIEESVFVPDSRLGRDFPLANVASYDLSDEELDRYLRRERIGEGLPVGEYRVLRHDWLNVSLEQAQKDGKLGNSFPKEWMRG